MASDRRQRIIGICGYKGSGKTTAADFIIKHYANSAPMRARYKQHNFTDPLKGMIVSLGFPRTSLDQGDERERPFRTLAGKSLRYAMQTLGTEWGRECMGKDFWVDTWALRLSNFPHVVVSDLRFMNEARKIKDLYGKIIRINRPGFVSSKHVSEKGIYQITPDVVILNDGDLEEFEKKVIEEVEKLF